MGFAGVLGNGQWEEPSGKEGEGQWEELNGKQEVDEAGMYNPFDDSYGM